ncbi:glycosyltransferase [Sphingomonas ginsenosidivorax]|uniref:Glycosyltransferase n=1 Tax=Sphingomonas ginsenosidivorax TaxID=862135 RepID=A0A5C6UHL4_9SPHN|nr:glycosyltransferase [Sphingomonas ginsenosidivorax]TXC71930.1 glycosyltransferase [Sphingomonas ginsenosidivorax]
MRPPPSILVVLHDFALGGTERVAVRLAAAMAGQGASVTIFAGSGSGPLRALAGSQVEIVVADPPIPRARGSRRRLALATRTFVDRRRFDGVYAPGNFHWPVAAALGGRGIAVLAQVSAALDKPQRGRWRQWAFETRMRYLLRRADAVVALSDVARDQANRILRRDVASVIALPALDDAVAPPLPVPDTRPPVVLAAGRLVPEKGFARLIAAFATLPEDAARLVIVGDGPQADTLRRQSETLGLADRVTLAGYVPDIRPALDAARLLVLSSDFEGFPAVLVEALAAGRPVVATDCTPATRLLADGAGIVVPLGDTAALSHAIATMLAQPAPDPARLAASVAQHRIGAVAAAYLALFDRLRR